MDRHSILKNIIKLLKNIFVAPKQPQPQPQPQPVQQSLNLESVNNEQTSFCFDDQSEQKKICPNCGNNLDFSSFRSSSKNADGLTKWCAQCLDQPRDLKPSNKKQCPHCKKTRLKTSFYKNSKQPDGLTKWCRTCMNDSRK